MPSMADERKGMVMRKVLVALLASLLAAPSAAAPPSAEAILRQAFENYRSSSSQSTVAMTIHRPDWERHLQMRGWTRGDSDALVRFTAPAKDAGNATLKVGRDTWVYNPKLNEVIQLPASMLAQSWMGSDFSYNDLSKSEEIITDYTHRLTATGQAGGHGVWTIEATPKPGSPVVWGKVVLEVRDDYVLVSETFYDQDGKPARRMTADRIAPLAGRPYPVSMTMHPLDRPEQWTRVETSNATFNVALPAYLFTLSNLQNPRS
jgi:outer membrane lipoprotein-sorting protein